MMLCNSTSALGDLCVHKKRHALLVLKDALCEALWGKKNQAGKLPPLPTKKKFYEYVRRAFYYENTISHSRDFYKQPTFDKFRILFNGVKEDVGLKISEGCLLGTNFFNFEIKKVELIIELDNCKKTTELCNILWDIHREIFNNSGNILKKYLRKASGEYITDAFSSLGNNQPSDDAQTCDISDFKDIDEVLSVKKRDIHLLVERTLNIHPEGTNEVEDETKEKLLNAIKSASIPDDVKKSIISNLEDCGEDYYECRISATISFLSIDCETLANICMPLWEKKIRGFSEFISLKIQQATLLIAADEMIKKIAHRYYRFDVNNFVEELEELLTIIEEIGENTSAVEGKDISAAYIISSCCNYVFEWVSFSVDLVTDSLVSDYREDNHLLPGSNNDSSGNIPEGFHELRIEFIRNTMKGDLFPRGRFEGASFNDLISLFKKVVGTMKNDKETMHYLGVAARIEMNVLMRGEELYLSASAAIKALKECKKSMRGSFLNRLLRK